MTENTVSSPLDSHKKTRRTQAERSEAMRIRLIEATLKCLEVDGYAGTTVTKIVEAAQVSRGAPVHHFPSKAALIAAAAEHLMRRFYVQLGVAMAGIGESEDKLTELIMTSWKQVFGASENTVILELIVASRRDQELATMLQKLWISAFSTVGAAAEHYLEPKSNKDNVRHLMILTQWLLRGMAMDKHLVFNEKVIEHYVRVWCKVMAGHLKTKGNVETRPPRPEFWDMSLDSLDS
ncbi:TetR/AcrR family transcriptional regulator [Agitococcus lubricus]|uniref:TetR family transcriptional regulator n=1 Tax=Agitococcus lubricus TaxID=1077255 RepID=A0A2T5J2J5_9GAMM|nr:TetR/AcrR family transcriptional regulator [Agitococcus lubricus]PTQ90738.1 TetR family transcriptional regulator [Agitococcus lubricus]